VGAAQRLGEGLVAGVQRADEAAVDQRHRARQRRPSR
jgi:hypothetical protein